MPIEISLACEISTDAEVEPVGSIQNLVVPGDVITEDLGFMKSIEFF